MQLKKRPWPVELGRPIILEDLQKTIRRDQTEKNIDIDLLNAVQEEQITRAEKICNFMSQCDDSGFLDSKLPATEGQWIYLVAVLCEYLDVPAFQVEMSRRRGPGAIKFWTDTKLCQFADVMNLANLSENGACRFIAANPKKFGDRYLRKERNPLEAKTLHPTFRTLTVPNCGA
jgi:hypothetical protein